MVAGSGACGTLWGRDFEITRLRRKVTVTNPADCSRHNAAVVLPFASLAKLVPHCRCVEISEGNVVLPSQLDDLDQDGVPDEIVFLVDLKPRETKTLWLASLKPSERGLATAKRVRAHPRLGHVGYLALESEVAAYGIQCAYPKTDPRGALQLDAYVKAGKGLGITDDSGGSPQSGKRVRTNVLRAGDTLGLAGPTIGKTRPRDGETAIVFHSVICDGPLRAGIEVEVIHWRTPAGGVYRAWLQYFMYAGQEFVELRATVRPQIPADEFFGIGLAAPAKHQTAYQHWRQGWLGHWAAPEAHPAGLGLGLVFRPQDAARVVGVPGAPSWLAGNQIVYLKPSLSTGDIHHWRLLLTASSPAAGIADAKAFGERLPRLAKELQQPILVDGRPPNETRSP